MDCLNKGIKCVFYMRLQIRKGEAGGEWRLFANNRVKKAPASFIKMP
jgi:hypothetical protein